MKQTIRVGRIAGIPIGFNWSLLIVVGLLTWTFAVNEFPAEFPGRSDLLYWTAAVLTTIAFFACLLAHEMGHALAARRLGVGVQEITLWLFGGVARIRGDDMNARSELRIALAGPLVSIALAGIALVAGRALSQVLSWEVAGGIVTWLGRINLILAIFNLIPAFPMDGGRIFRSLLWRRMERARATRVAVRSGRAFAFLMMAVGLIEASIGDPTSGLWLVFLGWFLANAAQAEESGERAPELGDLRVGDVMNPSPRTAPAWMTVDAFLQFASDHPHTAFPLKEIDGSTTGLATAAAVIRSAPRNSDTTRVREVACPIQDLAVARPEDLLSVVLARPVRCGRGWVVVFDDNGLAGLVSPADVERGARLHASARKRADGSVSDGSAETTRAAGGEAQA